MPPGPSRRPPTDANRAAALRMKRRRDRSFPAPRSTAGRAELYRLGDLVAWAQASGAEVVIDPVWLASQAAQGLARHHGAATARRYVAGTLLARWSRQSPQADGKTGKVAYGTARRLQRAAPDDEWTRRVADLLDGAVTGGADPAALLETVLAVVSPAVNVAATSTPDGLARLLVALADPRPGELVLDPAIGEGTLALAAARHARGPIRLIGSDRDQWASSIAAARLLLAGAIDHYLGFATRDAIDPDLPPIGADLVLVDPPLQRDLAPWVRMALANTGPGGRAVLALPARTLEAGNDIWPDLPPGTLETIIAAPDRLRTDTGDPLAVWVLTNGRTDTRTLLLDATRAGTWAGTRKTIRDADIETVARSALAWRAGRKPRRPPVHGRILQRAEIDAGNGDLRPERWLAAPDRTADIERALRLTAELTQLTHGPLADLTTQEHRRALTRLHHLLEKQAPHS